MPAGLPGVAVLGDEELLGFPGVATWRLQAAEAAGHSRQRMATWPLTGSPASRPAPGLCFSPGAEEAGWPGGLQGHAGQLGAVSEQLVLDVGIAGGGVCRAGFLVVEVAARRPCARIRADGQPCLGHWGE